MTSWLHRQRKQTLLDLSNDAGLKQSDDTKKDDIIDALDAHLQKEKNRLSGNTAFDPYYGTRRTPAKPRVSSTSDSADGADVKSVVKQGGKRPTKVKQEGPLEAVTSSAPVQTVVKLTNDAVTKVTETLNKTTEAASSATNSAITKTTKATEAASSAVSKAVKTPVPRRKSVLPPTPRDLAEQVEEQSTRLYNNFDNALAQSGLQETVDSTRDLLSSVSSVQLTFLALETYGLVNEVIPWKFAGDIPLIPILGLPSHYAVKLPDLFVLLTGHFWTTTLLWAFTSLAVPTVLAYFYNLTVRDVKRAGTRVAVARYRIDPLTFNVVKALSTWLVYGRGATFGFINPEVALRVNHAMFGGYNGVLVGAYVCILASLYEAAQRK